MMSIFKDSRLNPANWSFTPPKPAEVKRPSGFFNSQLSNRLERSTPAEIFDKITPRKAGEFRRMGDNGIVFDDAGNAPCPKPYNMFPEIIPPMQLDWYASQTFIGYQIAAMLGQHWFINKACRLPGRDAVKHGYDITVNDGSKVDNDVIARIKKLDKIFKIKHQCREFSRLGRLFGIRIAMPIVTGLDYSLPFNIDGVRPKSYKGIRQIDPYWITPAPGGENVRSPASLHFYDPDFWMISGKKVHRSHLLIYRNGEVPDVLKPTYMFGGLPLPQLLMNRVYCAERTADEAPQLALTKRSVVLHTNLDEAIANQHLIDQRLSYAAAVQDNYGKMLIGTEEQVEQFDTALADMDALIMTQYQMCCAIAEVPGTKMLATSPKGFNATGDFEMDDYHESCESIQENDFTPLVDRHHQLLIKSEFPGVSLHVEHNWNPVDAPSRADIADLNLKKAQTDSALAATGAIGGEDIRKRLIADPDSGYNGISPEPPDDGVDEDGADEDSEESGTE